MDVYCGWVWLFKCVLWVSVAVWMCTVGGCVLWVGVCCGWVWLCGRVLWVGVAVWVCAVGGCN